MDEQNRKTDSEYTDISSTDETRVGKDSATESGFIILDGETRSDSSTSETKRKRGRPRKTATSGHTSTENNETFHVSEEKISKRTYKKRKSVYTPDEAQKLTDTCLVFIETLAVGYLGDEARLSPIERALFQTSLPKALEQLSKEAVDKTNEVLFPLILLGGVMIYASRIIAIYRKKRAIEVEKQKQSEGSANHSQNGSVPQQTQHDLNQNTVFNSDLKTRGI